MAKSLVVHGHFYQPPRENPWTESIDHEPSAEHFRDWNERIHFECYRPNAFARVGDLVVNNYELLSFNFGPTLLRWLERAHPSTYHRLLEADRTSAHRRGGHGNAIAQGYHHAILPLANERDLRTEIRWGCADFSTRFGRRPEALWLPETACDDRTLGALIDEQLKFVILSPRQAERVRPLGADAWTSVAGGRIDASHPYQYFHRDGSGRSLAVFFYDGTVSGAIAFERLLSSSHALVGRLVGAAAGDGPVVNVATDGESYGHHFKFGDYCLAYALEVVAPEHGFRVTNYGEVLAEHPPTFEVELARGPEGRGTAWSCAHGTGRWSRDCGCNAGAPDGWTQEWRAPLRDALDLLRDDAARKFESAGERLFDDPWAARDDYVELLTSPCVSPADFLRRHAARTLDAAETERALALLEMQRHALAMYTSCGWFFNDVAGVETAYVLRRAGRLIELMSAHQLSPPLTPFLELLKEARSNDPRAGTAADVYRRAINDSRAANAPHSVPYLPIELELPGEARRA